MAKVIQVNSGIVSIGMDNGGIKEVRIMDLNFNPVVGDEVEVFETETKVIVTKKETVKNELPNGGININVSNASNNAGQPVYIAHGSKAVHKVAYCLFAFLLGGIGIHKFYAGKIGMGIVYVLFCWTGIPAILGVIECIIGLCKPADANGFILI